MTFGQSQHANSSGTYVLAGMGVVLGVIALSALFQADRCPRMQVQYRRALAVGDKYAHLLLDDARREGCRWVRRYGVREMVAT